MKIGIITQTLDEKNYALCAFLKWFEKIAEGASSCHVICLYFGDYTPPETMTVHSLGKESRISRWRYLIRLYLYAYRILWKKKVDVLFIHMNEIYIPLLWPIAKLRGIPIVWWKAAGHLGRLSRYVVPLVDRIVTSSETGFSVNTSKKRILGQGIDTERFPLRKTWSDRVNHILWAGRIHPVKRLETFIEAISMLDYEEVASLHVHIVGSPSGAASEKYDNEMRKKVVDLGLQNFISFEGAVTYTDMPGWYALADVFVSTSNARSLDKTVLEAMATGVPVINSTAGFASMLSSFPYAQFDDADANQLVHHLRGVICQGAREREKTGRALRQMVVKDHNVDRLINRLFDVFNDVIE